MAKMMTLGFGTAVMAMTLGVGSAYAQVPAASASVHGHVQNPAGQPLTSGDVKFTKDKSVEEKDQKFLNTFPIDKNGDYKGTGVAPGDYLAYVVVDGKRPDRVEVTIKAGEDRSIDFDMTRAEYLKAMTPEERTALEEYKKKAGESINANKVIAGLNATLARVRADLAAAMPTKADVSKDVEDMRQTTVAKPDESLLWITYGETLEAQGDHQAKDDRDNKKSPMSDEAVIKTYSDAVDAFKKGIELNAASKKPQPADQAVAYNQIGNTLAKMGKTEDASAAFENAVKASPANAGMYYGNEAAVLFNAGSVDAAAAAADKAIAAEPNRADPYYIRGQALITKATVDKSGKIVAPPGCVEAYQKYLELAPDGKTAVNVREILTSMGQTVNTKYRAPGKK